MKRIILILIGIVFCASYVAFAQSNYTESLTITTYYPAPYGVYRQMEIHRGIVFKGIDKDSLTDAKKGELIFNQTDEKLYIYNGTKWKSVGSQFDDSVGLVNSAHTVGDCQAAGGEVVATDTGFKQCKFSGISCPSGWTQYKGYTETSCNYCTVTLSCGTCPHSSGCHSFSNIPGNETFVSDDQCDCRVAGLPLYCDSGGTFGCAPPYRKSCTATATRTAIGCY